MPAMMPMMTTVVAVVIAMVAVMPPMRFGRLRFHILLHRRGGAGIAERQRLGALGRSGQNEQGGNGRKSKDPDREYPHRHFCYRHICSPWLVWHVTLAPICSHRASLIGSAQFTD